MIKPISKKKYYETISEQIEQAILSGEWAEGSRVPTEDSLASIFDVGRGSIREAITNLQMSGVLVSSPGVGTYVSDNAIACITNSQLADMLNDPENLKEMAEIRGILEPGLAACAAKKASLVDKAKMQEAIDNARSGNGLEDWEKNGHLFHITLAEASHNKIMINLLKSVEEPTRKKMNSEKYSDEWAAKHLEGCQSVLDAVNNKDPESASARMTELLK